MAGEVCSVLQKFGWFRGTLETMKDWLRLASHPRRLTTHSTGADVARFPFARLKAWLDDSRPVNSGVGRLRINKLKFTLRRKLSLSQCHFLSLSLLISDHLVLS
jgi:hypothetical protein